MDTASAAASIEVQSLPARNRALRIAVVTETYPPEVNGVALTLARLVEGVRSANHDVQLIRVRRDASDQSDPDDSREILMRGIPIPRYPSLRMGMPARRALTRLWRVDRPDVVHIATEGPLGWSALKAALQLQLPVSSDFRTNFHAYSGYYGIGFLHRPIMAYLRRFHALAHLTLVPTEALRETLEDAGFRGLRVVARGVDTALFSPSARSEQLRAGWGVSGDDLVVCCVGRLAAEKNLQLVIRSWRAIQRVQPRARLLLVGDGPQRQALQAECPDAMFAGQRSGEDLAAHYASSDLFLFPSLTETFGNVTLEAMACGLPVVAFDGAAAQALISSGVNGLRVARGDEQAFVDAAVLLAGEPPRRQAIGARARLKAEESDWASITERFTSELSRLIASRKSLESARALRLARS
ncbi:MAG: glycosyltransferase family 4 protein [Pseudomonadota bacterium]|jgi:glycosyltransferase involved in cell wall biosynthesis